MESPILYLSRAINRREDFCYQKRQRARDCGEWEERVLYVLEAIDETAKITCDIIEALSKQMREMKEGLREKLPQLYSRDLLNILFCYPYTTSTYLEERLNISRQTVTTCLNKLADNEFLHKVPLGRENYFINHKLIDLFFERFGRSLKILWPCWRFFHGRFRIILFMSTYVDMRLSC